MDVVYPLDAALREQVLEIERMHRASWTADLQQLAGARAGPTTSCCRPAASSSARAEESLPAQDASEFNARRLEMTRNSLVTTWRQVRALAGSRA